MRKALGVILCLLVLAGVGGFFAYRNGVHPKLVLWVLGYSWDHTDDLQAKVTGDVTLFGTPGTMAASLRFKKPDLYDLDVSSLRIICGADALWVVVPGIKTGFRLKSSELTPRQMLDDILGGFESRDPASWVEEAVDAPQEVTLFAPQQISGERCWVLQWPARTGERVGGRLYVSQRTRAPVRFEQMDSTGKLVRRFDVTGFRRNTGLAAEEFAFKPMEGYMTVDYTYNPGDARVLKKMLEGGAEGLSDLGRQMEDGLKERAEDLLQRYGLQ
jgi:outer membrane lipoprotein-sorting protein